MAREQLSKVQEEYLAWILLPEPARVPSSKRQWAEKHDVHYNTVNNWEKSKVFQARWKEGVDGMAQSPERTQRLLDSLFNKGLDGDVRAAQLYLTATGQMPQNQTLNIKHENAKSLSDEELESLIVQMASNEKSARKADKEAEPKDGESK
jgi:hypothetical protein